MDVQLGESANTLVSGQLSVVSSRHAAGSTDNGLPTTEIDSAGARNVPANQDLIDRPLKCGV
jgi:hypothetical protein